MPRTPLFIAVAILLLAVPIRPATGAPSDDPPSRQKLQEMYLSYLREEGYEPTIDADGDIEFKMEGVPYLILIVENDPDFFEILMPNFWPLESEAERARALAAADHANATIKVAKVYTLGDNVSAATELFLPQPDDFGKVFRRSLLAVNAAVNAFVEQMRK